MRMFQVSQIFTFFLSQSVAMAAAPDVSTQTILLLWEGRIAKSSVIRQQVQKYSAASGNPTAVKLTGEALLYETLDGKSTTVHRPLPQSDFPTRIVGAKVNENIGNNAAALRLRQQLRLEILSLKSKWSEYSALLSNSLPAEQARVDHLRSELVALCGESLVSESEKQLKKGGRSTSSPNAPSL